MTLETKANLETQANLVTEVTLETRRSAPPRLPLTPLGPDFGAEIHGIDLARATDEEVAALRTALVQHKVLFVRGQDGLDDATQIEFGRRLGEVTFVNPGFTSHIVGVSEHESRGLLDILYAHLTKPEHLVRHRWRPGDVALWDNRSTAHYANRDYGDRHRVMHRITLRGDRPRGTGARGDQGD